MSDLLQLKELIAQAISKGDKETVKKLTEKLKNLEGSNIDKGATSRRVKK